MPGQERVQKPSTQETEAMVDQAIVEQDAQRAERVQAAGEAIKGKLDDLLDEVDDVLEVNAEEFVNSYIQKGGE